MDTPNDAAPSENIVMQVVNAILNRGVDGFGPFVGSEALAEEYLKDASYGTVDEQVRKLMAWECSKNFGTGFVTGLGGLITLPITLPAALSTAWFIQARLAGAIAYLHGHSVKEDRVRTLILLSLIGDAGVR